MTQSFPSEPDSERGEGCLVVRLLADFRHQLGVLHDVVAIQNERGARRHACERAINDTDAVIIGEARTHGRQCLYVVDGFAFAKAALGERQVCRDHQNYAIWICCGVLIEFLCRCSAYRGIEARYDTDELVLPAKSDKDTSARSPPVKVKSGAVEPTAGKSPLVLMGLPRKVIEATDCFSSIWCW